MMDVLDESSLFPPLDSDYQQYNILFRGIESLDGSCFYGRSLGFQVLKSSHKFLSSVIFEVLPIGHTNLPRYWPCPCHLQPFMGD
jgi:hypothetical protein